MKWEGRQESENVEDRRSMNTKAGLAIGGGLSIVVVIIVVLLGGDPRQFLNQGGVEQRQPGGQQQRPQQRPQQPIDPAEERLVKFLKVVLYDTETVWTKLFKEKFGETYQKPIMVFFRDNVKSGCGYADAGMGPFYCPKDQRVYLDVSFFKELRDRFKAKGDFAQAYVIAHEVAHHVQTLEGTSKMVHNQQSRTRDQTVINQLSVRLELQADFLAGIWAHYADKDLKVVEPGDIREALTAAKAIGDDAIQKKAQGYVVPDRFTHGTSEQRYRWFYRGFRTGDLSLRHELFTLAYNKL